jgi:hypothetical protein
MQSLRRQSLLDAILAPRGCVSPANQVPVEHLLCAYIGQSACQAASISKIGAFA